MNEDRAYREQGTAAYRKLRIPFDYSLLKKEIAKQYKTRKAFARAMGLPENSVCRKLNGKADWKQREIMAASMLLDISFYLMPAYFFNVDTKREGGGSHIMNFDYSLLRGKIASKYRNQRGFARAIGISEHSVSLKLNGKKQWRQDEIVRICELLDIPTTAIPIYFFREAAEQEARHDP